MLGGLASGGEVAERAPAACDSAPSSPPIEATSCSGRRSRRWPSWPSCSASCPSPNGLPYTTYVDEHFVLRIRRRSCTRTGPSTRASTCTPRSSSMRRPSLRSCCCTCPGGSRGARRGTAPADPVEHPVLRSDPRGPMGGPPRRRGDRGRCRAAGPPVGGEARGDRRRDSRRRDAGPLHPQRHGHRRHACDVLRDDVPPLRDLHQSVTTAIRLVHPRGTRRRTGRRVEVHRGAGPPRPSHRHRPRPRAATGDSRPVGARVGGRRSGRPDRGPRQPSCSGRERSSTTRGRTWTSCTA